MSPTSLLGQQRLRNSSVTANLEVVSAGAAHHPERHQSGPSTTLCDFLSLSGGSAQRRAHGRGFASATRAAWPSVQVPAIHQFQQQIWLGEPGHRAQHRRKQRWRDLRLRLWEPQLLRSHRRRQGSSRLHSPGCAGQQAARRDHVQGQELGR